MLPSEPQMMSAMGGRTAWNMVTSTEYVSTIVKIYRKLIPRSANGIDMETYPLLAGASSLRPLHEVLDINIVHGVDCNAFSEAVLLMSRKR